MAPKTDIKIEVFEDHLLLIFPMKVDDFACHWQDAWILGSTLEQAANAIKKQGGVLNPFAVKAESEQVRLNTWKENVVLVFGHTDRLRFSSEAARLVARAIRTKAQDLDLESRGVHMSYNAPGRKGRPTPFWEQARRIFGLR